MGGGKRKRNPGVGVDFKRVKQKVGKKLPKAQNDTDTSFKAASINLPSQTLKEDREGVPVNSHNLTLKELLSQSSHYSEKTRKGALIGMADLFSRHPQELTSHIGTVYSKLVERMPDGDADVRKALARLLREQCIPNIEGGALRPFMPMIMAHVCSAMTHLSLQVRNDALMLLDVLMDHCPDLIVGGFLCPCIQHFCDLLSPGHRASSMKAQSLKVLLKVLHALTSFLHRAFPHTTSSATPPAQSNNITTPTANKPRPLFWDRTAWPARGAQGVSSSLGPAAPGAGSGSVEKKLQDLSVRLLQLLCDCWLECSPGQLRTAPELDLVQALLAILTASSSIITNLIRLPPPPHPGCPPIPLGPHPSNTSHTFHTSQPQSKQGKGSSSRGRKAVGDAHTSDPAVGAVECLLQRVVPNFPATMPAVRPAPVVLEALAAYNLQAAQLLASFLPLHEQAQHFCGSATHASNGASGLGREAASASACSLGSPVWVEAVVSFFSDLMHRGVLIPAAGMLSEAADLGDQAFLRGGDGAYTVGGGVGGSNVAEGRDNPAIESAQKMPTGAAQKKKGAVELQGVPGARGDDSGNGSHAAVYLGVLKSVGGAVGLGGGLHAGRLLAAVDALAARSASKSAVRAACLSLQHDLLRRYQLGVLYLDACFPAAWLASLPKLLWELGSSSPTTTRVALSMLHDAARFCSVAPQSGHPTATHGPLGSGAIEVDMSGAEGTWSGTSNSSSSISCALAALQSQLAPLFAVQLPGLPGVKGGGSSGSKKKGMQQGGQEGGHVGSNRGARKGGAGTQEGAGGAQEGVRHVTLLAGPVTKLDAQLQELAVDCVYHMLAGGVVDATLLKSLLSVLHAGLLPVPVAQRCVQMLMWHLSNLPPTTAASALLSLLFPLPTKYEVTGKTTRSSSSSTTTTANLTSATGKTAAPPQTIAHHMASRAPAEAYGGGGVTAAGDANTGVVAAAGAGVACWPVEAQALADAVLGMVQAFVPAGLVLELLSLPLQARVCTELAGCMSEEDSRKGGNEGGDEGVEGRREGGSSNKGTDVGIGVKEAENPQGMASSKGGKGKGKRRRGEKEAGRGCNSGAGVGQGSTPAPGTSQLDASQAMPPPHTMSQAMPSPPEGIPGLTPVQLRSLIVLAKMAAMEAQVRTQPPATLHLHHKEQQEQQQHQQQQPQQSPWPGWLQPHLPRLAVHACLRCAQLAACPPVPVSDLAPRPGTASQHSTAGALGNSHHASTLHFTLSSGQASGGVQDAGVQEMLEVVVRLVAAWPALALLVLEEVGRSAKGLWEGGQQEAKVALDSSLAALQQQQQAFTAANTLLALGLSVLHQHAAVQQLLGAKGRAHSALASLTTSSNNSTRGEEGGGVKAQIGAASVVWADANWLKEVAHLQHVAERALGPAV